MSSTTTIPSGKSILSSQGQPNNIAHTGLSCHGASRHTWQPYWFSLNAMMTWSPNRAAIVLTDRQSRACARAENLHSLKPHVHTHLHTHILTCTLTHTHTHKENLHSVKPQEWPISSCHGQASCCVSQDKKGFHCIYVSPVIKPAVGIKVKPSGPWLELS